MPQPTQQIDFSIYPERKKLKSEANDEPSFHESEGQSEQAEKSRVVDCEASDSIQEQWIDTVNGLITFSLNRSEYNVQRTGIDEYFEKLVSLRKENDGLRKQLKEKAPKLYESVYSKLVLNLRNYERARVLEASGCLEDSVPYFLLLTESTAMNPMGMPLKSFQMVGVSPNFQSSTGFSPTDVVGKDITVLVNPIKPTLQPLSSSQIQDARRKDEQYGEAIFWRSLQEGVESTTCLVFRSKCGEMKWVRTSVAPIVLDNDAYPGNCFIVYNALLPYVLARKLLNEDRFNRSRF